MTPLRNRQVLIARRPDGKVTPANFEIIDGEMLTPDERQPLLRNIYLYNTPYLRGRMNDIKDAYAQPFAMGAPMGDSTVTEVIESGNRGRTRSP